MPLDLEVVIQSASFGRVRAQTRDISIGGMRLQAGAAFAVYQRVTLELSFPCGSPVQRWQAMVVHVANGSAGVMFEFLGTAELATLIELLRAADAQADACTRPPTDRRRGPAAVARGYGAAHVAAAGVGGKS